MPDQPMQPIILRLSWLDSVNQAEWVPADSPTHVLRCLSAALYHRHDAKSITVVTSRHDDGRWVQNKLTIPRSAIVEMDIVTALTPTTFAALEAMLEPQPMIDMSQLVRFVPPDLEAA